MADSETVPKRRQISSVGDLIAWVKDVKGCPLFEKAGEVCYRGHEDAAFSLLPSVQRSLRADAEQNIISELLLYSSDAFLSDRTMFEKLVRAQHYALPTRLLDVTMNPLVGAYFSLGTDDRTDGQLYMFGFAPDRIKYPDSDSVALICNIARLTSKEREDLRNACSQVKSDDPAEVEKFRSHKSMRRLLHFVRDEKPAFEDRVEPKDLTTYYLVRAKQSNRRIIAQSGAFIASGLNSYQRVGGSSTFPRAEAIIPKEAKPDLRRELELFAINHRTMFPDLEDVARHIARKWKVESI
ncbi:FRG domain-containing protein [Paracoccus sp. MC1854]|uniref:FRG domain-containing protein n=1 Tax=Paracoccus sp. MC1854 TaxID=2760306 RepID=UPI001601F23E|nr:FRG domain-containing protein [Paracoccus sp. MC1854]MBB1490408.1 FRG domain-containing protein [Paracoccus sp. MC1854]